MTLPRDLWHAILERVDEADLARLACAGRWTRALVADLRPALERALDAVESRATRRKSRNADLAWTCSRCLEGTGCHPIEWNLFALECGHLVCGRCSLLPHAKMACAACGKIGDVVRTLPLALSKLDFRDDEEDATTQRALRMTRCAHALPLECDARARLLRRATAVLATVNDIACVACHGRCDPEALVVIRRNLVCGPCAVKCNGGKGMRIRLPWQAAEPVQ